MNVNHIQRPLRKRRDLRGLRLANRYLLFGNLREQKPTFPIFLFV